MIPPTLRPTAPTEAPADPATDGATDARPTSWDFRPETEIAPGRRVLTRLGGGERYEAVVVWDDHRFAPLVAKVLRPHLVDDPRARRAFERESTALTTLTHPALVRHFETVAGGAHPHLLLEYLDGPRLSTLVRRQGPLAAEQLVPLGQGLAAALVYVAREGWLHLDVKPRNVVMTGAPRLIDLSIARPLEAARRLRGPVGTDVYMAPEQCDPARFGELGPAADVWGLGVSLYEAATGRPAYPREPDGPRHPQLTAPLPAMPPKLPAPLAETLFACLDPDPASRPTAVEVHDRLEALADWSARLARRFR